MTDAKHTPGPWSITTRQGSWDWVVFQQADPNIEICQPFHDDTEENETGEANARLISAAPELYAGLSDALRMLEAVRYTTGLGKKQLERIEKAKAALAKACPTAPQQFGR